MDANPPPFSAPDAAREYRLGAEWDEALLARLARAVVAAGGSIQDQGRLLAGSQYIQTLTLRLPTGEIEARAETYEGLVLRGPARLVETLIAALDAGRD